jgi:hypothetical protein
MYSGDDYAAGRGGYAGYGGGYGFRGRGRGAYR